MNQPLRIAHCSLAATLLFLFSANAIAGPRLTCEEPAYNFGEREEGGSVEHAFVVKNVGDTPVDMKSVKPQCACTVLSVAQDTLPPGAETAITLRVSLGGQRGLIRKTLAIAPGADSQERLTLTFEGAVVSTLYVEPDRLELGHVDADHEVTRSVIVAFAQEEAVKITKTTCDTDLVVSEVKALKDGGLYRVTVRVKPLRGMSTIRARLFLYTDSAKHPLIVIPIAGEAVGDLAAMPSEIILAGDPQQLVTRYLVVVSPRGKPFEIKGVECPTASVKAEVVAMGTAGYRIELSGLTATTDVIGKTVVLKTSLASTPVFHIPLQVTGPFLLRTAGQVQKEKKEDGTREEAATASKSR